ncbi:hypothetical protein ID0507_14990 [Helicobacter pylori]
MAAQVSEINRQGVLTDELLPNSGGNPYKPSGDLSAIRINGIGVIARESGLIFAAKTRANIIVVTIMVSHFMPVAKF